MDKFIAPLKSLLARLRSIKLPVLTGSRPRKLPIRSIILWGVAVALAIGAFLFMQQFTACWQLTALPGMRPSSCPGAPVAYGSTPDVNAQGTAVLPPPTPEVAVAPEVDYPQWDGGSRINIVFFGLRGGGPGENDCPLCTDTIIVFTIDPVSKTAGMISVPRDMYVNIPGEAQYSRINTAWTFGEAARLPGGGPVEAMKTVSQFLGVPIQYYIQVNFDTFISFINLIGGIDVYNTEKLVLDPTGAGTDHVKLTCCGIRHLDGRLALAYARCRDQQQGCTDGDVGRSIRQQKVLLAIRNKVLSGDYFAKLMGQAPQLYTLFSSGVRTNISLQDSIKLAMLAKDIPFNQIQQGIIDNHMTNFGNVTLGGQKASILMPIPDKIRVLRDQIFSTAGATSPMAKGTPEDLMKDDAARVRVVNDSSVADLDTRTGNFLLSRGMQVTERGAPNGNYSQTVVIIYSPRLYTLRYLISPLGMITSSSQIVFKPDPTQSVDIEIRIGNDWAGKLPAGY